MANYQGAGAFIASFICDKDLTSWQYRVVTSASTPGNVASATSACTPYPIGVLINDPSAGQEAAVVVLGFTKAKCRVNACVLDQGTWLTPASDGYFEPAATAGKPLLARYFGDKQTTADTSVLGGVLVLGATTCALVQGNF